MSSDDDATYGTWSEVVYLLVTRYQMPEPAEVANHFIQHLRDHGKEVPAIAAIRCHLDSDRLDLASFTDGEKSTAEVRSYFHDLLKCYDELDT